VWLVIFYASCSVPPMLSRSEVTSPPQQGQGAYSSHYLRCCMRLKRSRLASNFDCEPQTKPC
jgi:hypothetical protein